MGLRLYFLAAAALVTVVGCREKTAQISVEQRTIETLKRYIQIHARESPISSLTNVAQLYLDRPYPHGLDQIFRRFGEYAGFTNSFYERYVFAPSGITNRIVEGEVLLFNAQPFPDREGKLGRMVLSRASTGDNGYRIKWITEKGLHEIFEEAGVEIPKPVSMPAPPGKPAPEPRAKELQPPPFFKFTSFIDNFASIYGLNGAAVRNALLCVPIVLLLLTAFWLWRRSRR